MNQIASIIVAVLALAGAASPGAGVAADPVAAPPASNANLAPSGYTLGPGDKIRLTVFGEPSLNGEYTIGPDGLLAVPLIGGVAARGKTVAELQAAIAHGFAQGYILDPRVSVDMLSFRPFYILGEVNRPGQYPYADGLSVAQAVATAGGYTYRARTSRVFIRRANQPAEEVLSLKKGKQVWVYPGDTIRVGERYF
ncbi:MAG: polysaccharide export protein [Sphingomonas bacterium]|nr:polysaccharide export protein [Sphingomonas bacterium]MDB5683109.1 polysaccharide export protein [Sphingomonas bacterium]MDB5716643.1 polysaccharide export protein [Sphingomonas bacterium]